MNILRKSLRNVLAVTAAVFGLCASPGIYAQEPANKSAPAAKTTSQAGNKQEQMTIQLPVMVLVPIQVSTELENKGCWVKLYDKKNYEGDSLMLSGPINMGQWSAPLASIGKTRFAASKPVQKPILPFTTIVISGTRTNLWT